jgi:hypothetical protein
VTGSSNDTMTTETIPGFAAQTIAALRRAGVYLRHRVTENGAVYVWTTTMGVYRLDSDGTIAPGGADAPRPSWQRRLPAP